MTDDSNSAGGVSCPVCGGTGKPLLALPRQPIYQHPVPADVRVAPPLAIDLAWTACTSCAHGWQPEFDQEVLSQIYRSHYYTPAPDGMAVQFRNDFVAAMERFGLTGSRRSLLEIGSATGDVLSELKARTGASHALAFEPNKENAAIARQRGLDVRESFFGSHAVIGDDERADLIYARHVIEHIFDFADFFKGLRSVAAPDAVLVLETPSLDWHAERASVNPFHVEHVHVFSLRSLARLCGAHGWMLQQSEVTADGNLTAAFNKKPGRAEPPPPLLEGLQRSVDEQRDRLQSLLLNRELLFWGAGSAGVCLAATLGREPDIWTDGNPNKVGKRFIGLERNIVSPQEAFAEARSRPLRNPVLVIASSFTREILPRVRELGWREEVRDLEGNLL